VTPVRSAASLIGVLAAVLLAVAAPLASGSTQQTRLLGDSARFYLTWQVRPASILYTEDSSGILGGFDGTGIARPGHLKWSKWSAGRAVGSGAVRIDGCKPSCSGGTFTAHAVSVVAFRAVGDHFTRLTLRYTYRGKQRVEHWGIRRIGSSWSYYLVGR
jgi:hypothetical protein